MINDRKSSRTLKIRIYFVASMKKVYIIYIIYIIHLYIFFI